MVTLAHLASSLTSFASSPKPASDHKTNPASSSSNTFPPPSPVSSISSSYSFSGSASKSYPSEAESDASATSSSVFDTSLAMATPASGSSSSSLQAGPTVPPPVATKAKGRNASDRASRRTEKNQIRNVDKEKSTSSTVQDLLEPYKVAKIPSTSRVDTSVEQRQVNMPPLWQVWKFVPFLAEQASAIGSTVVSHHLWGPTRPTWGPGMTIFTTCLRISAGYSHLSSLPFLRGVLAWQNLIPPSKDTVVTPHSFRVRPRNLKGFLSEVDKSEDGTRILEGEWVVSRSHWRDIQREYKAQSMAPNADGAHWSSSRVMLYLHGGAYYIMSPSSHRSLLTAMSKSTGLQIFAIDYRLSPETIFPGALYDAVQAYFRLVDDLKIPPENIMIGGDSAGGGLALALMMYLRDNGYPMPSGAILISPWVDLTMSCASWDTNCKFDYLPAPAAGDHLNPISCYLGPNIGKYITHPYASPLFGDFHGLPPLLIQGGEIEVLVDEGSLMAHKATLADVYVEHEIYKDMPHVHVAFLFLDAAHEALASQRRFVRKTLPTLVPAKRFNRKSMDGEIVHDAHRILPDGQADQQKLRPDDPIPSDDDFGYASSSGVDTDGTPSPGGVSVSEFGDDERPSETQGALEASGQVMESFAAALAKSSSIDNDGDASLSEGSSLGLSMGTRRKSTRRAHHPVLNDLPAGDTTSIARQLGSDNGMTGSRPSSRARNHSRSQSHSHLHHAALATAPNSHADNDAPPRQSTTAPSSPRSRRNTHLHSGPPSAIPSLRHHYSFERTTPLPTPGLTPRGAQSHPELVALIDSYEAMKGDHHTVLVETSRKLHGHAHLTPAHGYGQATKDDGYFGYPGN